MVLVRSGPMKLKFLCSSRFCPSCGESGPPRGRPPPNPRPISASLLVDEEQMLVFDSS